MNPLFTRFQCQLETLGDFGCRHTIEVPSADDALLLLDRSIVGALPVLDDDQRVIGILSVRDLMKAYKNLFGLGEHGSAMLVVDDDGKRKPLTRIAHVLEDHDIRFTRLIRTKEGDDEDGKNKIYIRVHTYNVSAVHSALEEAGFKTSSRV